MQEVLSLSGCWSCASVLRRVTRAWHGGVTIFSGQASLAVRRSAGATVAALLVLMPVACHPASLQSEGASARVDSNTAPSAQPTSRIDSAAMLSHVRVLSHDSLEGRRVGTPGGLKAREYIRQKFAELGLEQFGPSYVHEVMAAAGRGGAPAGAPPANVIGVVRGRSAATRYIVITAHYDHLGVRNGEVFNGADDNASGTGALLALARYFKQKVPSHSIIFVAFDSEESGLRGARAFVASPPVALDSIIMNVNMDMVGRNAKDELYVTGTLHYPYLKQYIEREQPVARVKLLMGHDVAPPGGSSSDNWTGASDHGAFHGMKIPFLYFGVEDHPDYHKATDEFERLMPGFYVRAIETVLDVVLALDADGDSIRAQRK